MTKSIFEQMGGTYTQQGDYLLPDLKLPEQEETNIGIWGMRYRQWLKATHRVLYYNLLTKGELNECLAEADERAENMFSQLVSEIAEREGLTQGYGHDDMGQKDEQHSAKSIRNCLGQCFNIVNGNYHSKP